ncbi:MAG: M20/M25/M40 family metallo-hydrolase [Ignavibacteria bacterium]|nr:M20/M25/M40 family metallo-hydrolase [Ignavibacteria bacterium]
MIDFLIKILEIDSTSGKEETAAEFIAENFKPAKASLEIQNIPNGKKNVFFKWGKPKIIFCSHLDTVPPYIPPKLENGVLKGRGACDAKGQIAVMYETCRLLEQEGKTNFGLLMLAGEEIGSYGAIEANKLIKDCQFVIVGEPTENKIIEAGKGNLLFEVAIKGKSAHSGYPEKGDNAVERMRVFLNKLSELEFPIDDVLGKTTYNIGLLSSNNAHNVISDFVKFKIFFRTTFASHHILEGKIKNIADDNTDLRTIYGDEPIEFYSPDGFEKGIVSYGSDAPDLYNLGRRLLYGPGTILVAHTENEFVEISELEKAVINLKNIFYKLEKEIEQ